MKTARLFLSFVVTGFVAGCGVQPASLVLGDGAGGLELLVDGSVETALNVNVDANIEGDIICTLDCNLNTGECETVCELADGEPPTPPTPAELGEALYVANCGGCHGNPPGPGNFGPDLTGESAADIMSELDSGGHPGGPFDGTPGEEPLLTQEDIDNIAAFLAL